MRTNKNIRKVATGQVDDYITGCLLDYLYFEGNYKLIAIDSKKQQVPDTDLKLIQQINFIGNINRPVNTTIIEEVKETINNFLQGSVRVL